MPSNPLSNPHWAPDLADTIEKYVGLVRDKTTAKAIVVVRAIVFGFIIGVAAIITSILAVILGTKLLQRLLTIGGYMDHPTSVWVSYLIMGALLCILGAWCMHKRSSADFA